MTDENQLMRAALLSQSAEIERLRSVTHGLMKILARPWMDGGVSWADWDAAMTAAEAVADEKSRVLRERGE